MTISRPRFLFLYTFICLIWGSTWVVIRIGEEAALDPFVGASLRFILASVILWSWVLIRKAPMPKTKSEWWAVIINGSIGTAGSYSIVYWSSQYIPSGIEAVIFGTMPLWTVLIAMVALTSEPLTKRRIIGVLLGFLGLLLVFLPSLREAGASRIVPMIVMLGSPIVSAVSLIVSKKYARDIEPVTLNALSIGIATLFLTAIALSTNNLANIHLTSTHLWTIGYLGIVGTVVSFMSYYYLLRVTAAIHMSYVTIITPVIAVFLGWILLNERLSFYALLGGVIVLIGIRMTLAGRAAPTVETALQEAAEIP